MMQPWFRFLLDSCSTPRLNEWMKRSGRCCQFLVLFFSLFHFISLCCLVPPRSHSRKEPLWFRCDEFSAAALAAGALGSVSSPSVPFPEVPPRCPPKRSLSIALEFLVLRTEPNNRLFWLGSPQQVGPESESILGSSLSLVLALGRPPPSPRQPPTPSSQPHPSPSQSRLRLSQPPSGHTTGRPQSPSPFGPAGDGPPGSHPRGSPRCQSANSRDGDNWPRVRDGGRID